MRKLNPLLHLFAFLALPRLAFLGFLCHAKPAGMEMAPGALLMLIEIRQRPYLPALTPASFFFHVSSLKQIST
jgi:hypothetical protein